MWVGPFMKYQSPARPLCTSFPHKNPKACRYCHSHFIDTKLSSEKLRALSRITWPEEGKLGFELGHQMWTPPFTHTESGLGGLG